MSGLTEASEALLEESGGWPVRATRDDLAAIEREVREPLEARIAALEAALRWALDRVPSSHETTRYAHPEECSPSECHCGYWKARALAQPAPAEARCVSCGRPKSEHGGDEDTEPWRRECPGSDDL
jgi:hypothetical protein